MKLKRKEVKIKIKKRGDRINDVAVSQGCTETNLKCILVVNSLSKFVRKQNNSNNLEKQDF